MWLNKLKTPIVLLLGAASSVITYLFFPAAAATMAFWSIAQLLLFLIGVMTMVEAGSKYKAFQPVVNFLSRFQNKRTLGLVLLVIGWILSAVLDNVVAILLLLTLIGQTTLSVRDKSLLSVAGVVAVNVGGAWSPIGDITTTMLWVGGQVTTWGVVGSLFLPCLAALVAIGAILVFMLKGTVTKEEKKEEKGNLVLLSIILGSIVGIPLLHELWGVPAFIGAMIGSGIVWTYLALNKSASCPMHPVLQRVEWDLIFFLLGLFLLVESLFVIGIFAPLTAGLSALLPEFLISNVFAVLSLVIGNVAAVALGMKLFTHYAIDHAFWKSLAFTAGVGGSLTPIGSAAGTVALTKVSIKDYMKYSIPFTTAAYGVGMGTFLLAA